MNPGYAAAGYGYGMDAYGYSMYGSPYGGYGGYAMAGGGSPEEMDQYARQMYAQGYQMGYP